MKLSIIIANFNYGRFVRSAIDSALSVKWDDKEVIVVDDGSTDDSRKIIRAFLPRIRLIEQPNRGQVAACNAGFAASSGDVLIFLDADDRLHPDIALETEVFWTSKVSKIQVRMRVIDADGKADGSAFPGYPPDCSPARLRRWYLATASYPTPPGSGNLYMRSSVAPLFPLSDAAGHAADSTLLAGAPLLGDVVTIARELVDYRVHGRNDGAMTEVSAARIQRDLGVALARHAYAVALARSTPHQFHPNALRRNLRLLAYRVSVLRIDQAPSALANDSLFKCCLDLSRGIAVPQGLPVRQLLGLTAWLASMLVCPKYVAQRLTAWRFAPSTRPKWLRRAVRA